MLKQSITIHLLLSSFIIFSLFPIPPVASLSTRRFLRLSTESEQYAVIFDAGSTGSRVHVFLFDQFMNLLKIGQDLEFYNKTVPGLSDYANDPKAAAQSLLPLLKEAENVIPQDLHAKTPVRLGATAGLRMLEGDASERILEEVREMIANEGNFQYSEDSVSILDGYHEGAYMWVTTNYLLGTLGKSYPHTVATIELGGGSMQMAYAISKETAENAPKTSDEDDPYVKDMHLVGIDYSIYAHSYLNYGLYASRAEILAITRNFSNPCVTTGYQGVYDYDGVVYKVISSPSGANLKKCRKIVKRMLKLDAPCNYQNCTFNGAWNGGGGEGLEKIYVASFLYEMAYEAGITETNTGTAVVRPIQYLNAAKLVCKTRLENLETTFPHIDQRNLAFLCMDLTYQYTLLVHGFGLNPLQELTAVETITYENSSVEVAWPLGCGIDIVSSINKLGYHNI